ncbi:MAG: rhomboid family intramembrane serine protease [Pseudomonadota bacterium]
MPNYPAEYGPPSLPRPGKVTTLAMCLVGGLWLAFAIGVHWAGVGADVFELFCGNTPLILHGQVWRVLTAALLQAPNQGWHVFGVLLTLYFFAVPLEKSWGRARLTRFLLALAIIPALVQVFFDIALPPSAARYFAEPFWFGGFAVCNGLVVAWSLQNRGAVVRLYGVLPISSHVMIWMALGSPLVYLIFREVPAEGVWALYGGCFAGWLLGASTPSPLRRYWLQFRLGRLDAEAEREAAERKKRLGRSGLKVIDGGRTKPDPDPGPEKGRGADGRWLN